MVMKRRVPGILENLLKNKEETRYANLAYVSIVLLTILSFRLFFMQIIEGSYYKQEADGNRIRTLPIIASRGVMYDRNGILMVGSRASYGITMPVDRKKNSLPETELRNLADLLKTSPAMLQKKIEDNKAIFGAIYLAKDVSLDVATEIEEKKNDSERDASIIYHNGLCGRRGEGAFRQQRAHEPFPADCEMQQQGKRDFHCGERHREDFRGE